MTVQISNPEDRKKIKNAIIEISDSMTRIEAEKDLIKQITEDVAENFEISKKHISTMAKIYHKQNFAEEQTKNDEFEILYLSVVEGSIPEQENVDE